MSKLTRSLMVAAVLARRRRRRASPRTGRVRAQAHHPPDAPDVPLVGGFCGVIVALMEQNSTSDEAIEAGHGAFDRTLRRLINDTVPTLRLDLAIPCRRASSRN